jgi:hypothetical protein
MLKDYRVGSALVQERSRIKKGFLFHFYPESVGFQLGGKGTYWLMDSDMYFLCVCVTFLF